ncbi:MAG: orotate phosphoribosyltransferase, partial [Clostridia bacterium]
SLSNFDVLAHVAAEEGYIKPEQVDMLLRFRNQPADESWMK